MIDLLRSIGLYGWRQKEATIFCALLADYPIMFYGSHGQGKTVSAEVIARSYLGKDIVFQPHDYSRMSKEELVGVLDPKGLQRGELRWIPTPTSVWGADAMLFDEFTFGNIMMGSMVHELLTHKTVMGQKTKVQLAMAACNPPDAYQANYINLATCSRFILVQVPSYQDIEIDDSRKVLREEDAQFKTPPPVIKKLVTAANARDVTTADHTFAEKVVSAARSVLGRFVPIRYSTRQEKMLYRLCLALRKLDHVDYSVNLISDTLSLIVSTVPELSPLVALSHPLQAEAVLGQIKQALLDAFKGANLLSLVEQERITDQHGWAYEVFENAMNADAQELKKSLSILSRRKDVSPDIFNILFCQLMKLYAPEISMPMDTANMKVSVKNFKHVIYHIANSN